jgi:hypothetical protein
MSKMSRIIKKVKVNRISSINDPETGQLGKQIELVEVRPKSSDPFPSTFGSEESKMVKGIMMQFQSLGLFPQVGKEIIMPKLTMFLTEDEYDMLGIRFEVNDVYDLVLKDGTITLKKSLEGV